MILAGDVGGTKTLVGLFEPDARRPRAVASQSYATTDYPGLPAIVDAFIDAHGARASLTASVFGVAGPILDESAEMTNVDWRVDGREMARTLGLGRVQLLNDLQAMAYAVPVLENDELLTIQARDRRPEGNMCLIAAGTGLGTSILHRVGGRYVPVASEGGHADYAARTARDLELTSFLRDRYGRAELEHVVSGPGLINLSDFAHREGLCAALAHLSETPDVPAEVSRSALERRCPRCVEALEMFVDAYGAAAGNLALTAVTTGGVFIGGGIAPRVLPALQDGRFVAAFNDKGPMRPLLESMAVQVILNADAGLLGAAVYAQASVSTSL